MAFDTRVPEFTVAATAGLSEEWVFTDSDATAITSLSVYVGGTSTDVDDYTDATQYTATISGASNEIATVSSIAIPTGEGSTLLRLVVDGAVQGIGKLVYTDDGSGSSSQSFSLVGTSRTFSISGRTIVGGGGGGGISDGDKGDITVTGSGSTWSIDAGVVGTTELADGGVTTDKLAANAVTAAKVAADVATQAELDAEASLARNADNLTSGTVADARIASTIARDSEVTSAVSTHAALTATHGVSGDIVGTSDTQSLTNKTVDDFSNDVEADAVHIQVRNESGVLLEKGTPVYISGYSVGQDVVLVDDADATSSATMPCIGLLQDDIDTNATGACLVNGRISGVNTGSFSAGDLLYVSETAGALTSTRPTGTAIVQVVGEVLRSHASLGVIDIDRSRTTQTGFIATLLDDGSASDARTTLGVDAAGTDNSTDVTLAGTPDYLTIAGQVITRNQIDLTTDVTGDLPVTEGGTGASDAPGARTNLGLVIGTDVAAQSHADSTANPHSVTASQVGLGNVDNTSDANKPVSTAQQAALDLKANLASPTFTGTPAAPTASAGANSTQVATTAYVDRYRTSGTFSNADHTITTETYLAQTGTLSADRTVTLPAASSVPRGYEITIVDEAFGVGVGSAGTFLLTIQRAGSDELVNPVDRSRTTSTILRHPGDHTVLVSNGTDQWTVIQSDIDRPASWWTNSRAVAIPNNTWTPLPWNSLTTEAYGVAGGTIPTATTTIGASSDSVALPQATINVADTSSFTSSGFITITGPPGASVDTIVRYTGKTATTFTGCNTSPNNGIATGTMATGQTVTQVIAEFVPQTPGYYMTIAEAAWAANGTGVRGIRYRSIDGVFNFAGATTHWPALNISNQHTQVTMQPAPTEDSTVPSRVEVFQTSGGVLNVTKDGIQSPSLMQVYATGQSR